MQGNDKVCNGANVSREHLHFIKSAMGGAVDDWENIRWSIVDQGKKIFVFNFKVR